MQLKKFFIANAGVIIVLVNTTAIAVNIPMMDRVRCLVIESDNIIILIDSIDLPRGTYDLPIDDTVWSASTWVFNRIARHIVAEAGAVVVTEAGAVVVTEAVTEAVATECKHLLVSKCGTRCKK
jgi:hypothetical protein